MHSEETNNSSSCPPWKYRKTPNSPCECGSSIGEIVKCTNGSVCLSSCHCMSYSEKLETVIMGSCPHLCENYFYFKVHRNMDHIDFVTRSTGLVSCVAGARAQRDMPQLSTHMEVYVYSVLITSTTGLNILQLLTFWSQCFMY